ncbi:DNA phosphorothioation-dependent restriction protein DptG [Parashewanella spongiae]|uniref:DNA phosphorothioation-dependent restriction protein DptG n=1 Tax=Parashewanella spongiae TaxID=342950 RepID=A0A3A6U245_9GAMM|nr:DNA phosphorothioation-dependent restriction protein DptG [Parashewanella spongiae]MCL1076569.1 DNA phosphorothioation-dependent restriction protein DptG [Parashewanella spongiae]RJY19528.1 DNA phosphorothioation-dependent restriction protein DptG [Parashewanella spongiae]
MINDQYSVPFNENLAQTKEDVPNKNALNSYFPLRTKGNDFEWDAVIGLVLSSLLRKEMKSKYSYEDFNHDCKKSLEEKLSESEFWQVLQQMYFDEKDVFSISPELLLFRAQKNEFNTSDQRISSLFINLMQAERVSQFDEKLNFIEQEFLCVLRAHLKDKQVKIKEESYLPHLTNAFKADLRFLSSKPKYLLSEFKHFLSFYGFTYAAQLSLAISDWITCEEPKSKPLYFIMDHEKASNERTHVKLHGYKLFSESSFKVFPILTMLEQLQKEGQAKVPLWKMAEKIKLSEYDCLNKLRNFALAFRSQRNLDTKLEDSEQAIGWLGNIVKLTEAQFRDDKTDRPSINKKYVGEIEKYLAYGFIQSRGRSGKVLVLNQDYTILLTNLVIAHEDKLRFHELLLGFQQRGIFVDKQTEQELIKFYERIGNIERMSDSGDAVYVRKTI